MVTQTDTDLIQVLSAIAATNQPVANFLEAHTVDVTRLRDDHAPIQAGEEVMFVATAHFRLLAPLPKQIPPINEAPGSNILTIRNDADLVSPLEIATERTVRAWLKKHFEFDFLIDGKQVPKTELELEDDPPWVLRLNTGKRPSDYLNIEVDIRPLDSGGGKPPVSELARGELLKFRLQDELIALMIEFDPGELSKTRVELDRHYYLEAPILASKQPARAISSERNATSAKDEDDDCTHGEPPPLHLRLSFVNLSKT
jgi:hypothetical protein